MNCNCNDLLSNTILNNNIYIQFFQFFVWVVTVIIFLVQMDTSSISQNMTSDRYNVTYHN